ncbi:MAG: hypothetical protein ACREXS_04600 [Gammaproteobacteria bacterium]
MSIEQRLSALELRARATPPPPSAGPDFSALSDEASAALDEAMQRLLSRYGLPPIDPGLLLLTPQERARYAMALNIPGFLEDLADLLDAAGVRR